MPPNGPIAAGVLLSVVLLAGCDVVHLLDQGPPAPTPYPTVPATIEPAMAKAIAAAEPFATELSRAPVTLKTAFVLDLTDACKESPSPCDGLLTGPGWGIVFDITDPVGKPSEVLVVLDGANQLVYTQQ
jgi:hypothetical protein